MSSQLQVLVVEDDAVTGMMLSAVLRARGHEVTICETGEEALPLLEKQFFPLIILDLLLPGMDGAEFCRKLRERPDGHWSYVLIATANHEHHDLADIMASGANDYTSKPLSPEILSIRLTVAEQQVAQMAIRRELESQLAFLALNDPLTGMLNRSGLVAAVDRLRTATERGKRGALLYIDLDHFKIVNDALGHAAGDRLLVEISALLRKVTGSEDQLFRFGGDEFVVALERESSEEFLRVAEAIRNEVENFVFTGGMKTFRVGVSIGVALALKEKTPEQILAAADAACYTAKLQGRNQVHLSEEHDQTLGELTNDTGWSGRIHQAIANNHLELWYQPVMRLPGLTVAWYEGLVRYVNEETGIVVSPSAFLPVLERSGGIAELDAHMFHKVCEKLEEHPDMIAAINISARSLQKPDLVEEVENRVRDRKDLAERLILEITGASEVPNIEDAIGHLSRMVRIGVRLAIDDFGRGTSSLLALKQMPSHFVKIDGEFVHSLRKDPFNISLLEAVAGVVRLLNRTMVAEWVEDEETAEILKRLQIEYAQGFYFGEPKLDPFAR